MEPHFQQKSLLVHACCAHCTEEFLLSCSKSNSNSECPEVILYFDNSNIHPRTEYIERLKALQSFAETRSLKVIVADWSPKRWFEAISNWQDVGRAERCEKCWSYRLTQTAVKARQLGISSFTTTMLTSSYMNTKEIERIGKSIAGKMLEFVSVMPQDTNATSKGSERVGNTTLHTQGKGYYQQNYCGCVYSLRERYEEKYKQR